MRAGRLLGTLAAASLLAPAGPLGAQELQQLGRELEELLEDLPPDALGLPPEVGEDRLGIAGLLALETDRMIHARELAERALAGDPESYVGHCLLGAVQYRAEGNLPRADYHFRRCLDLFQARHGAVDPGDPWYWHHMALQNLYEVNTVMDRQQEALTFVDRLEESHPDDYRHLRSWPLVELGRYEQARASIESILASPMHPEGGTRALSALCFLEGEVGTPEASYRACRQALERDRAHGGPEAVHLTNAAEAARALLRAEESEELLLEATGRLEPYSLSMPWMDLLNLYLDQGRMPEALDAMREMLAWRDRHPASVNVQNRAFRDLSAAELLLVAGRPFEASLLTARVLDEGNRLGRNSVEPAQLEAAAALLDRAANRAAAALRREEASWSGWRAAWRLHAEALGFDLRAWRSGRRLVALLSDERRLASRFTPRPGGAMRVPEWLEPDLVELVGAGVVDAALGRALARGRASEERGYAQVFAAESAAARGDAARALARADEALSRLPRWEALLRARVAARAAGAALELGDDRRAAERLDLVFQIDPGVLRRMPLALPCRIDPGDGPVTRRAARLLAGSPRLRRGEARFRVALAEGAGSPSACLLGLHGVVLACFESGIEDGEAPEATARRLARGFHERAFAPRVDLTQGDLKSLDGSTVVAGGRGEERTGFVLRQPGDGP